MYRQTRIFVPYQIPFDSEFWAETVVGGVIVPSIKEFPELEWFWFSRYDCPADVDSADCDIGAIPDGFINPQTKTFRSIRFRYSLPDSTSDNFEKSCRTYLGQLNCWISDFRDYNFIGDLGGDRHLGGERSQDRRLRRAQLIAELYCLISRLIMDALIGPDEYGRFRLEKNDSRENPLGSSFESIHHLFCNITNVPLRILFSNVSIGTDWSMPQRVVQFLEVKF